MEKPITTWTTEKVREYLPEVKVLFLGTIINAKEAKC